jgi:hypothetical protein
MGKEILLGYSHTFRVDGQISEKVRVNSGVLQGRLLSPLLYLDYVNDIWKNTEPNIRLFADDCVIYREKMDSSNIDMIQRDLNSLGEWAVENEIKVNPVKNYSRKLYES